MNMVDDAWGVVSAAVTFVVGLVICLSLTEKFCSSKIRVLGLYCWHSIFCIIYVFFVVSYGGDAIAYFDRAQEGGIDWRLGTPAVSIIALPFVQWLGFSFLSVNLVFNILGAIGLIAFDASLRAEVRDNSRWVRVIAFFIVILPSVSFWSVALGKDSIAFMAIGLALWAALQLERRFFLMGFAIALMLIVRPHMAALLVLALGSSIIFSSRISLRRRLVFFPIVIAAVAIMTRLALNYSGLINDGTPVHLGEYIDMRQSYNMEGGAGVDISSMSPPVRVFTYLFRPLPFEANNIFSLAASIDNLVIIFLVIMGCWGLLKGRQPNLPANRAFMWFYVLASLFILSLTTANLGISMRQKWMFLPMLIFLLLSVLGKRRGLRAEKRCIVQRADVNHSPGTAVHMET